MSETETVLRLREALDWITKRALEGHGAVQFGFLEDGNLAVWIGEEQGCRGIGNDALEVIQSAIHGEKRAALAEPRKGGGE